MKKLGNVFVLAAATCSAGVASAVEITTERFGFDLAFEDPGKPGRWTKSYDGNCGDDGATAIQFHLDDQKTHNRNGFQASAANIRICAQVAKSSEGLLKWCSAELERWKNEYAEGFTMNVKSSSSEEFEPLQNHENTWSNATTYRISGQDRRVSNVCVYSGRSMMLITSFNRGMYDRNDILTKLVFPGFSAVTTQ
jgi:hypothetical protein